MNVRTVKRAGRGARGPAGSLVSREPIADRGLARARLDNRVKVVRDAMGRPVHHEAR